MIDLRSARRFGATVALSGAAHAAIIAFSDIAVPEPDTRPLPLAARIVTAAPEKSPPAREAEPPLGTLRASRSATAVTPSSTPSALAAAPQPEDEHVHAEEATVVVESAAAAEEPVLATATAVAPAAEMPRVRALPRKGRITYNLVYGRDRFPVGRTVQTWELSDARYLLASRSVTSGIVDVVRSQHRTFTSRGALTAEGLQPETFVMSRNRGRGTEEARAQFDWRGASVALSAASGERHENLPARTQDVLSFTYQLAIDPPPPGRFRQALTNGARLETYEIDVLPHETIETPIGSLRVLPVRQVRKADAESLDVWLATQYRYLPVRIRFFNREGELQGEQIVTEIRLSEE